jgi:hypothetical protein
MTRNAKRMRAVLNGRAKVRMADKYAVMATIHQWHFGVVAFDVDMSDCIPILEAAIKADEPKMRALIESWQQDVHADAQAETN